MENNIDTTLYNEKSLYLLNIRELRDIGRKFGVPSPTTMKKQDLIEYILKIVYGEVAPSRSNYGRPNVREFNMNNYIDKIKKNSNLTDELLKLTLDGDFDIGELKVASPKKQEKTYKIENRVFVVEEGKCYLREHAFIKSEKDIEINEKYVKKLNLENFDVLEVKIQGDIFKIITINGVSVESVEKLVIKDKTLESGDKHTFYVGTKEEREKIIDEVIEKCDLNGLNLFIFANKKYTDKCKGLFVYNVSEGYSKMYKTFMTVMAECEKLAFEGEDFVVLFENAADIDDMLSSFEDDITFRVQQNVTEVMNKILGIGNILITFRIEKEKCF